MISRLLWTYLIRRMALAKGYIDPISLLASSRRFGQPCEVVAPAELLRATIVLHARGLLNTQAIQHNLDWIWPFWVNRQFDPLSPSFIPRAFSLTHINLTHRNWTAIGLPAVAQTPVVDPRGLVMPFWDSWSIDAWVVTNDHEDLIPARAESVSQQLDLKDTMRIITASSLNQSHITSKVDVIEDNGMPVCRIDISAEAGKEASLVISLRPYNPEGVSLVKNISVMKSGPGWIVNKRQEVYFNTQPDNYALSNYCNGDVYLHLDNPSYKERIDCSAEMATAAAIFHMDARRAREVVVTIPLLEKKPKRSKAISQNGAWVDYMSYCCHSALPDKRFEFLFESSLRAILLHTIEDVYAGPYTYRRFWFRDAVYISYALLCCGFNERVEGIIDKFSKRQKISGYFESQNGEWDSNGQVLWLIRQFCLITGRKPKEGWKEMIYKAGRWIQKKRLPENGDKVHSGLMPTGFSAEHLGPNDYYYWDDFWSAAGLKAAAYLCLQYGDTNGERIFKLESDSLMNSIDRSLEYVSRRLKSSIMPSSPYRRLDSASVGSLVSGYPLQLWPSNDKRLMDTAGYLFDNHLIKGGLFHNMSHSGINPYLTLHMAQVFLRAGDPRYLSLMKAVAELASETGSWPEAVHPHTRNGCMGDGEHVWTAAEWILLLRNLFVREEGNNLMILCSGIPREWVMQKAVISFGPAWTEYGKITIDLRSDGNIVSVSWHADWHKRPDIEVRLFGAALKPKSGENRVSMEIVV